MQILIAWILLAQMAPAAPQPALQAPPAQVSPAKAERVPASVTGYFEGTWSGSGTFVKSGNPLRSTYSFEPALDGEAMLVRHSEEPPQEFQALAIWSVDTVSGDLVMMLAGNLKGGARLFRSPGWEGDRLVFRSDPDLRPWFAHERFTFVRESPTRFRARYEMSPDGENWGGGDEQVFVKP